MFARIVTVAAVAAFAAVGTALPAHAATQLTCGGVVPTCAKPRPPYKPVAVKKKKAKVVTPAPAPAPVLVPVPAPDGPGLNVASPLRLSVLNSVLRLCADPVIKAAG